MPALAVFSTPPSSTGLEQSEHVVGVRARANSPDSDTPPPRPSCAAEAAPPATTPAPSANLRGDAGCTEPHRLVVTRSSSMSFGSQGSPLDTLATPGSQPGAPSSTPSAASSSSWSLSVMRCGMASNIGCRSYMEDRQVAVPDLSVRMEDGDVPLNEQPQPRAFFGVFDGHGGDSAAQFAVDHFLDNMLAHPQFPHQLESAMGQAFATTDRCYETAWSAGELEGSGTTALAAVILGRELTVANLGDCRAVISRRGRATQLSNDQKPSTPREQQRIVAAGGHVCGEGYLNSVLGVSRAIGNYHVCGHDGHLLKRRANVSSDVTEGPLIAIPEIQTYKIGPDDEFLVLATDGLWDVLSSERCVELARKCLKESNDPTACAKHLVQTALDMHTGDNVSVQVICFGSDAPPERRPTGFSRVMSAEGLSLVSKALGESCSSTPRPITPINEDSMAISAEAAVASQNAFTAS